MSFNSSFEHYVRHRFDRIEFEVPNRYTNLTVSSFNSQGATCSAFDAVSQKPVTIRKCSRVLDGIIQSKEIYRDIKLLRSVNSKFIISLIHAFTPHCSLKELQDVYLVTELVDVNLSLLHKLDLKRTSYLMYQLLCGVKHLHSLGIILRDLKPSSVAVNRNCSLKITNFGMLKSVGTAFVKTPFAVTRNYRAPEVLFGLKYKENADVWSVGCIFGELVRGSVLFPGSDHVDIWESIVQQLGSPSGSFLSRLEADDRSYVENLPRSVGREFEEIFPDEGFSSQLHWYFTRDRVRNLLRKMLIVDSEYRISIDEALEHDFISTWYEEDEINAVGLTRFEFNLDEMNYTAHQWKKLIYQEVLRYKEFDLATFGVSLQEHSDHQK